jgi:cobalt/nickel transport protein
MTTTKKLWIGIAVLALLSPLGLIIPALFGAGGAWGEWGLDEIKTMLGYIPRGMEKLGRVWNPPMKDYAVPGPAGAMSNRGWGYVASAFIGVALTAGLAYLLARLLANRNKRN